MRELGESYPMNTNMTGFRWFSKIFAGLVFWKGYGLNASKEQCIAVFVGADREVFMRMITSLQA